MRELPPPKAVARAIGLQHASRGLDPARVGRVVEEPHERAVHDAQHVVDLAQLARCHKLAGLEARAPEVGRVVHHQAQLGGSGRRGRRKRARLGHVHRHRLLHQNMLAGGEELEAHLGVARVGRANDHAVQLVQRLSVRQQLLARAKQRHALVPLSEQRLALKLEVEELGGGGLFAALHDGADLGIRVAKEVRQMPALRPPCSADDGYPRRRHVVLRRRLVVPVLHDRWIARGLVNVWRRGGVQVWRGRGDYRAACGGAKLAGCGALPPNPNGGPPGGI
eukprot:scaffold1885_cov63-Phaeocystis_antarctica.AAC.2